MFCDCVNSTNLNTDDYWFGLYKLSATPTGTTAWYDGNPSTYRDAWVAGEPNENTVCIRYTKIGFKDRSCSKLYYYTCKKPAGKFSIILTICIILLQCVYNSVKEITEKATNVFHADNQPTYRLVYITKM